MGCDTGARKGGSPSGIIWILGIIGAAIYFIGNSQGFWGGVVGLLKALVWPVFLVWKVLEVLKV